MARIATTVVNGVTRIVTKVDNGVRRASCSCCETETCCPYNAELFQSEFFIEDLPDQLISNLTNQIWTKQNISNEDAAGAAPIYLSSDEDESITWAGIAWTSTDEGGSPCLTTDISVGTGYRDTFEDTYTVSGIVGGTVTRESLCVWRGSNLVLTNYSFRWRVNGQNKSGNNNTPIGSYGTQYSVA